MPDNALTYTPRHDVTQVEIEFDPPLAGYEEVRPRLLQMKAEAESSIGMVCLCSPSPHCYNMG